MLKRKSNQEGDPDPEAKASRIGDPPRDRHMEHRVTENLMKDVRTASREEIAGKDLREPGSVQTAVPEGRGLMQDPEDREQTTVPAVIAQTEDPEDSEQITVRQDREPMEGPEDRDLITGVMEGPGPRGRDLQAPVADSGQGPVVRMMLLHPLK